MKYRYLGSSGLAVSTICLGTMTFGQKEWGCDENVSFQILDAFIEQGGNFIDTADKYANTDSERIIGEWLKNQTRDKMVIGTKCFFKTDQDINSRGLSRKHIISACEASLKRLKTDYIDLYQIHGLDPQTPLEETLYTFQLLMNQGKIRYYGISNFPAWLLVKSAYITKLKEFEPFISGQYLYNLLKRDIETEILPACSDLGINVLCWSPLSGGMLTGKYTNPEIPPENSRIGTRSDVSGKNYSIWYQKSLGIIQKIKELSEIYKQSPSTIALSWLLFNKQVASVITGAKSRQQIIENCKAGTWEIMDSDWELLHQVSKINYGYPREWCETNNADWYEKM